MIRNVYRSVCDQNGWRQGNAVRVFDRICRIAQEYRSSGDSMTNGAAASGLLDLENDLAAGDLVTILRDHSSLVNSWFSYSEDKRTSGGYYIGERGKEFVVGSLDGSERAFADRIEACANFICLEMNRLRRS